MPRGSRRSTAGRRSRTARRRRRCQERGGREVVAGDRDAVLPAGEGAAAVVEVARLRGGAGDADDHHEVTTTNARKIAMFRIGLPNSISAHLQLVAQRRGDRVQRCVRVADVQPGDEEGHEELAEAEHDPEVQVAQHRDGHEPLGVRGQQHVGEVPDQEGDGHGDGENRGSCGAGDRIRATAGQRGTAPGRADGRGGHEHDSFVMHAGSGGAPDRNDRSRRDGRHRSDPRRHAQRVPRRCTGRARERSPRRRVSR